MKRLSSCLVGLAIATAASASDLGTLNPNATGKLYKKESYSPYAGRDFPTQVFWGDTHLHTNLSMDAGAFGNRLGLEQAYRFSKGEEVTSSSGITAKLSRPMDFTVIADHSDGMGFFTMIAGGDPRMMAAEDGRRWNKMINSGNGVTAALELIGKFSQGDMAWRTNDPELMKPVWNEVVEAAERHNDPGNFTAFIGYEWTSLLKGNNLHRVVIYQDDGDKTRSVLPYTLADSADPENLWEALQRYEDKTGGSVLAIAHNGNLSNGLMFDTTTLAGKRLTRDYAERRQRWEPVYEATQIKGDGEAHPFLSPDDEFADYETWDLGNLDASSAKTDDMLAGEYARSALKRGLLLEKKLGVNPYKFGMIGSTDSHTSLPAVAEENFFGKHAGTEPSATRIDHPFMKAEIGEIAGWQSAASGYAGVWARENTRASLWDAIKRREVYATTGTRMMVRFFGGWEFEAGDEKTRNPANVGYAKGVPMGGELNGDHGKAPSFLVGALRDPIGANLDRIQVIKGWLDGKGKLHEKVYDVAWSDAGSRELDGDGKLAPVGSTVDVANANWTNTIGDPELITLWTDPDFDPDQRAFYYARVLEIPTPRWTAYDAKYYKLNLPEHVPMTTQERAYTSPIWYNP
jgi:hypothetical protein